MNRLAHMAVTAVTALGIAAAPLPVAAETNDVAKTIAGLVALGIVAKVVDDRDDRKDREQALVEKRSPREESRWPQFGRDDRVLDDRGRWLEGDLRRYDRRAQPVPGWKRNTPLPERCLYVLDRDRGGNRLVYSQNCLGQHFKWASRLPRDCRQYVRTRNDVVPVYSVLCLERDGWRVSRR